ncbi:tetratricopeptide repeat-containing sulfotransferase family protein [Zhongshania aquimaris]|uniref:Sulfotransferase n=1 Tax=Zhongshania aquimaris TaxID=2857107 RepID=A0ABS6VNI7_9GAMM|nr:sulfotransferase [Zhongshania aquimaris]MBW2939887.1 sulfotransferase [Zhongshania aquimaris]
MASKKGSSKPSVDKHERKDVAISLPGRSGNNKMPAAQALNFANQLGNDGKWPVVIVLCRQLLTQIPQLTRAWHLLFKGLVEAGDYSGLLTATEQYLSSKPRDLTTLLFQTTALRLLGQHDKALQAIDKALRLAPANTSALNQRGVILKEMGNMAEALDSFNRCVRLSPLDGYAYWNRSDLLRDINTEELKSMEAVVSRPAVTAHNKARIHYALARAYEFQGDTQKQFSHIEQGAKLKRGLLEYHHADEIQQTRDIPKHFSQELLKQTPLPRETKKASPIFICGLPRSGTTLVEQIISTHSMVTAGDELVALQRATAAVLRQKKIDKPFPLWANDLSPADWKTIGDNYQSMTSELHGTPFFTDKNLQNYKALGLIHLANPEAKIIFCRRAPMDNLWGCYRQYFADGLRYTYDQEELADTYQAASELYRYWQSALPDKVFFLEYETLISDYEATVKALLHFLDLPWEENCLHFFNNPRPVRTTSATQVRSPINTSRVDQWKKFEQQLQPMYQRLIALGEIE